MALPPTQQHALNAIDDVLQSAEPRLATMFGVFTDLTQLEAMPAAETLPPGPWWARWAPHRLAGPPGPALAGPPLPGRPAGWPGRGRWPGGQAGRRAGRQAGRIVLIPVLLLAAASLLVLSLVSSGTAGKRGCGHAAAAVMLPGLSGVAAGTSGSGRAACPAWPPATDRREQVTRAALPVLAGPSHRGWPAHGRCPCHQPGHRQPGHRPCGPRDHTHTTRLISAPPGDV